jgi:outer membrane protein, multidrug efflux system
MSKTVFLLLVAVVVVPSGCMVAPKYTRPDATVPPDWPTGAAYHEPQATTDVSTVAELGWREFFLDEKLQQVIELALTNNRDLRLATLNVERARALYRVQRNELYPALHATAGGGKQRASTDLTQPGSPRTTERYDVSLGVLSWELDFFGYIRSLKAQALETYLATEEARCGVQILLVSSVANAYLALAADREGLALAESTFQTQKAAYELVHRQYDLDIATELDLRRAQTPMEAARGNIARYTQLTAQAANALHLLVGGPVPSELLSAELGRISPNEDISPGLSSEVLLRRPDIVAAEHQLKGAYAVIGAARAAFFPRISLTAALGTASDELSGLFKSGTGTWSYGPQLVIPIFDARTWAAYRVSKVQREIAVTRYEKAIQSAFREVVDALAVCGTVNQQVAAQQSLVNALAETYRLSELRYTKGIDSYLGVLDAQRSLFAAQQGLISLRLARLASQVRLYAVLGGGWQSVSTLPAPR